jgi:probable F420-dependent oxidoreductase
VWISHPLVSADLAAELERLGYGAVWLGSSPGGDLETAEELLAATERIVVATGVVNVWKDDPRRIAAAHHRLRERFPGRFLLGIGIGHREATVAYRAPLTVLNEYLDVLDAEGVPAAERVVAALGPKALRLAAERSAGAHPYLVTPAHTRGARAELGPGVLLAPEHKVALDPDPERARARARRVVAGTYLPLRNYRASLERLGFAPEDLTGDGSDHLIEELVAQPDAATAAARVTEHLAAGADHVAIQVLADSDADRRAGFRSLAEVLALASPR